MGEEGTGAQRALLARLDALEGVMREVQTVARSQNARAEKAEKVARDAERLAARAVRMIEGDREIGAPGLAELVKEVRNEVRLVREDSGRVEKIAVEGLRAIQQERAIEAASRQTLWTAVKILGAASGASLVSIAADLLQRLP